MHLKRKYNTPRHPWLFEAHLACGDAMSRDQTRPYVPPEIVSGLQATEATSRLSARDACTAN
jgi:hypothetical protein